MDNFLDGQHDGTLVKADSSFTLARSRTREKVIDSTPPGDESIISLLLAAVIGWGYEPSDCFQEIRTKQSHLYIKLPDLHLQQKLELLNELQRPFGQNSAASLMARALFRWSYDHEVSLDLKYPNKDLIYRFHHDLVFKPGQKNVPDFLRKPESCGLTIRGGRIPGWKKSIWRKFYAHLTSPERLLPLESLSHEVQGNFEYRTKPFTSIRSYSVIPENSREPGFLLDLWEGPYSKLDEHSRILNKQEAKREKIFLFIHRWKSSYGNPTMIHHFLDRPDKLSAPTR